ncbi:MAG: FKBP-type peptidyl-prolyl cis-trans isomerase SlpA [Candidatus Azotimanducaceae bacterium]|jgi:FKBP-type peptidyl-prolyl cis-trans isomerase SlpA
MADISPSATPVGPGTKVTLTFSLSLESGEVIDSTGDKPADFVVGDGNLLPGFEKALFGLKAGDSRLLKIASVDAFGEPNEDNVQRIKRSSFQSNMELAEGLMMSFSDAQNSELPGVVVGIDDDYVDVDFNHPLSGKTILFDVSIVNVDQVSNEILRVSG